MGYKLCKFCENRARDGGRLFSTFWSNLSKNFSFLGPTPLSLHRWGDIWRGGGDPVRNFTPSVQRVDSAGQKTSKSASE